MNTTPQTRRKDSRNRVTRLLSDLPLRLTIIIIAFIWTLPTVGLLISSL